MKDFSSLRSVLVCLVLAAIAPLFVFALIRLVDNFDRDLVGARQKLELAATAVAHAEDKVADSARQLLVSIASVPKLGDIAGGKCADYFRTLRESLPGYTNIGVNSASGITLCHADSTAVGGYVGDQEYFKEAVANGSFVASSYFIGRISNKPLVAFALPIKDTQGQTTAVAFAALDFSELAKAVGDVKLPPGSHLLIMDRAGMVLADNLEASAVGKRVANPLLQKAIQAGSKGLLEGPDANGIKQTYVLASTTRASDSAFFIAVGMNFNAMMVPASQQLTLSLIVLLLITGLGCLLAWLVGGRTIVKPLHVALKATQNIQVGQLEKRISVIAGGPDHELTRIADGFKQMAGTLEQGQQEQAKNYRASSNSQRKLLEVQRLGNIGNWEFDFASQRLTWSDEVHALWGVMPGSFDGRFETMLDMIHPIDRASFKRQREEAMRDQLQLDHEFRVVTPQGDVRWLHQTSKTDFNEEGVAVYCAGVVQDITARKQTELALARSTDLLQRTGKMASVGGWEISFAPLTTHWTDEIFLIHDLVPGTRLGARRAIRFFRRDAQPLFLRALRAALAHGRAWDLELPLTTAKGRRIWVRTQGKAMYRDGKFFGLSGVLQDITTQHDALAQLRLLETCVSRLNDIVLITEAEPFDEPGERIVFVNDAFERQTGYSREEVIGKTPSILQGPKTQRSELDRISAELKKWQPVRAELINYTKTGEEFWVELDIVPVAATEGWFSHWVTVQRDISQRKLAEQALRDSEQRYFALFEDAPVPMWVYDAQTYRFLAVNSAATHDYGYSRAEFLSMSIFDVGSEVESHRLKQHLALETADSSQCWLHRRKDGSELTVRRIYKPIQYAGKCAMFAVIVDVSAQAKAENEVSDYLATLQRAAVATQAIPRHLSLYGLMDEVAVQARTVIGAHQAVISLCSDTDWASATHTFSLSEKYADYALDSAESDSEPSKLLSMGGVDVYATACKSTQVMRLTQPELESHPGWLDAAGFANHRPTMRGWMAIPLVGRSGTNIGLLQLSDKFKGDFTLQDEYVATELARLASIAIENALLLEEVHQLNIGLEQRVARRTAALARQEALFRALAEQAPQVIWTLAPTGEVTYLNRAWFDLMGGQLEDWDGPKCLAAVHPEDMPQVQANWEVAVANQTPYSGMRRLLAKDGSYHAMSYRGSPVLNAEGKIDFWVGIDADVSEIKAIEAALLLSNQELESFSYSVSHDLRSPLNTIDGFIRLLSKQLGTNASDKEKHFLTRIQAGVAQMGKLIEDLLLLAQVSRMQLQNQTVDLTDIGQHIAEELQARQRDRAVTVHIEEGLHAHGDAGLIRIVMENLLGNAWKFTSHVAHADIRVGLKTYQSGSPVFFVSDNGAGFDMAYADKLYVAFQRLHLASEFPGTGIGLATVSRAIARHGGLLWAEAAVGKGATFFFTLPRQQALTPI